MPIKLSLDKHPPFPFSYEFQEGFYLMRLFLKVLPLVLFFALSFLPREARADEVVINTGSFTMPSMSGGSFTFQGQGMTLNGWINGASTLCSPCTSGQTLDASLYGAGLDIRAGSGIVNGVSYDHLYYDSQLRFTTASFTVPNDDAPTVTLTVPFTFEGVMQGCTESVMSAPCPGGWVFSSTMRGEGIATLQLSSSLDASGNRIYSVRNISYNFSSPTATPEPATLLLMGTGLAGVAAKLRRRRRKSSATDKE